MFFRERQLARRNAGGKRVRTLVEGFGGDRGLPEDGEEEVGGRKKRASRNTR